MNNFRTTTAAIAVLVLGSFGALSTAQAQTETPAQVETPAQTGVPAQAETTFISWSQLAKQLEDQKYVIDEIEKRYDGWEVRVYDSNGDRLKLYLSPSGEVIVKKYND